MSKKYKHILTAFFIVIAVLLVINILLIILLTKNNVDSNFYDSINVAALVIAFSSFVASAFFSLVIYLQSKAQERINEKLPKKDDQYIIANYSLLNFYREISIFTDLDEDLSLVKERNNYFKLDNPNNDNLTLNRVVFLVSDTINKPIYKVEAKSVEFLDDKDHEVAVYKSDKLIDGVYANNILNRKYNCVYFDFQTEDKKINDIMKSSKTVKLHLYVTSIFNVRFEMIYRVSIGEVKDVSNNEDKNKIKDLSTYLIHHSIYNVISKEIVWFKSNEK